jgi:hypothetical protein
MDLSQSSELDALALKAKDGDMNSILKLSQHYRDGDGVTRNDAEAFKWAKLAAENGSSKGYRLMQTAYEGGYGVEKSADEAISCKINADVIEGKLFSLRPNCPEKAEVSVVNGIVFVTGKVTYVGDGIDIGEYHLKQKFNVDNDLKKWSNKLKDESAVTLVVVPEVINQTYDLNASSIEAVILHNNKKCFISSRLAPNRYLRYLIGWPLVVGWNVTFIGPALAFLSAGLGSGIGFASIFGLSPFFEVWKKDKVFNRLRTAIKQHSRTNQKPVSIAVSKQNFLFKVLHPLAATYIWISIVLFTGLLFQQKTVNWLAPEHSKSFGVCIAYHQFFPDDANAQQRHEMIKLIEGDFLNAKVLGQSRLEYKALLTEKVTKADRKDPAGSDADYMVSGREACEKMLKVDDPIWRYSPIRLWHSFVINAFEYSIFEYRVFLPAIYLTNFARSSIYKFYPQFFKDERFY